ncbi:hypothetical protein [Streptomyces sp. CMB-StM0423]|uniref:hypothetical protein n=1 Tax=Streptomyces sp. CMB-StM0423 TaxID=2059884 RepID=UPI000C7068E2|nr:hypothetical protein [Streptomyces sp. CMB-StM0423]AUH40220.1 hypothetical protein CXR04_08160 [Streptomyces sp. CMB-StM0423]
MRRRMRTALAALPLALTLALAGCGSGGGDGTVATAGGEKKKGGGKDPVADDMDEQMLQFARCLRENGVDVPDPEPGQGVNLNMDGVGEAKAERAMEACREYDPATTSKNDPISKELEEKLRAYSRCMRSNGVADFPDPVPGGGLQMDGAIERDPDYDGAAKACKKLMPAGEGESSTNEVEGE